MPRREMSSDDWELPFAKDPLVFLTSNVVGRWWWPNFWWETKALATLPEMRRTLCEGAKEKGAVLPPGLPQWKWLSRGDIPEGDYNDHVARTRGLVGRRPFRIVLGWYEHTE